MAAPLTVPLAHTTLLVDDKSRPKNRESVAARGESG
jgi:hypothetical protein